ncbi:MAG: hypothetical protein LBP79_03675 [Clostridiales bacterium]|jgi:desulfoferrodoxin|nr:hypothetical protein [Clostridiales bacterium]
MEKAKFFISDSKNVFYDISGGCANGVNGKNVSGGASRANISNAANSANGEKASRGENDIIGINGAENINGLSGADSGNGYDGLTPLDVSIACGDGHIPVIEYGRNGTAVKIGKTPHPMTAEHYIAWICAETRGGAFFRVLAPVNRPEAFFPASESDVIAVYAYCTVHGLLKAEIPENNYNQAAVSAEFTGGVRK